MTTFRGIFPAMLTPFAEDGTLRSEALDPYVEFLIDAGVHGLHPGGTTGESPLMTGEERAAVTERVVAAAGGRIPVIAQVGHLRTHEAVRLARHAVEVGSDAISIVTPYYYALPDEALHRYFTAVAAAVPDEYPVYLYNIPQCTHNPVTPELLARVMRDAPNVRGLKHSQPDVDRLGGYLRSGAEVEVFVGSDGLVLAGLAMGAVGAVSGNANVAPESFVALWNAWRDGRIDEARSHQRRIATISELLGSGGNLSAFKVALGRRGIDVGTVRDPHLRIDDATSRNVDRALALLEGAPS